MVNKQALALADETFEEVFGNPQDTNTKVITARRVNKAKTFKSSRMIKRADNAEHRVRHMEEAVKLAKAHDPFAS